MTQRPKKAAYDVAVIGLGAIGSAALFYLAQRGIGAIGIEQFEPGHDRGSSHGESRAIRLGYSEHPSYVPLVRSAFDNWRALERITGETILTTTGILEGGKPGSRMLQGSLDACLEHGLDHEVLSAGEVRRRVPAIELPEGCSAIWQPEGGFVRPELGNALHLQLARQSGAEVLASTKVLGIEPTAASVELVLEDRTIEAGSVIVSAGAWIADLVPQLAPHLHLTRQVLCWYHPKRPELFKLGVLPVFAIEGEDDIVYGFPDFLGTGFKCASHYGSGTILHADDASKRTGSADEARTRRFLERYVPQGAGKLLGMKTCMYTMTPDEDFIIDRLPEDGRIVVASPCSGHGYKFASVIGEVLADLTTTGATRHDISRFRIGRFA
jgi:sarcosine oxidase